MYAVSLALGASNAYVAVAPVSSASYASLTQPPLSAPAVRIVANAAGHRSTPTMAAFTEHETIFGDIAGHLYAREPQHVVPYVFAYAAAAAAVTDCGEHTENEFTSADFLRRVVAAASQRKFRGHCALSEEDSADGARPKRSHRLGFIHTLAYATGQEESTAATFTSAEDLFIQFLDYIKHHVIDAACGLTASDGATRGGVSRVLCLTVVVPRYAFPSAACDGDGGLGRTTATQWLYEAVRSSQLGEVAERVAVLFSDEATLLAYDSVGSLSPERGKPLLLSASRSHMARATSSGAQDGTESKLGSVFVAPNDTAEDENKETNVLVVDWGTHALTLTLLSIQDGVLLGSTVAPGEEGWSGATPFMCFAGVPCHDKAQPPLPAGTPRGSVSCYFSELCGCGGDAVDVALAERVAAHFVAQQRRHFATLTRAQATALAQAGQSTLPVDLTVPMAGTAEKGKPGYGDSTAAGVIAELIPGRALRRLRLLIGDKKAALNTNQQTINVAVEVEAFYEGMDLMDTQVLNRNKFDAAVRGEWGLTEFFDKAWEAFAMRYRATLTAHSVNYVVLAGGMCQIATLGSHIRQRFAAQSSLASAPCSELQGVSVAQSVVAAGAAVLDATAMTGSGVGMDELACMGGGQHSFGRAVVALREQEMRSQANRPLRRRGKKAERKQCEALAAAQRTFQLTERVVSDRGGAVDRDGDDEGAAVVEFLARNVYLYSGSCNFCASHESEAGLCVCTRNLVLLFAKQTPLPCRRTLCLDAAPLARPVLYFFVDAEVREVLARDDRHPVRALTSSGVVMDALGGAESAAGGVVHIVITIYCRLDDDGVKRAFLSIERQPTETIESPRGTGQLIEIAL